MVLQLAQHNPKDIYVAARTESKASAAIDEIKTAVPGARLKYLPLDLCSFESISNAASTFKKRESRLDVLVNNAGIMAVPKGTTADDYEIQMGTNHVGHFLLTRLLLPILESTAAKPGSDVRIVNLSSEGHRAVPSGGLVLDKDKMMELGPWGSYGNSKLANILFTKELAKRYPKITSVAVHPGIIRTDLYTPYGGNSSIMRFGLGIMSMFWTDVPTGTKNQLWAATCLKNQLKNGAYYTPVASLSGGNGYARDGEMARKLWDWSEREVVAKGF